MLGVVLTTCSIAYAEIPPRTPSQLQQDALFAFEAKIIDINHETRKIDNGMVRRYDTFTTKVTKPIKGKVTVNQPVMFVGWTVLDWNGMVGSSGVKAIEKVKKGDIVRVYLEDASIWAEDPKPNDPPTIIAPNGLEIIQKERRSFRF